MVPSLNSNAGAGLTAALASAHAALIDAAFGVLRANSTLDGVQRPQTPAGVTTPRVDFAEVTRAQVALDEAKRAYAAAVDRYGTAFANKMAARLKMLPVFAQGEQLLLQPEASGSTLGL